MSSNSHFLASSPPPIYLLWVGEAGGNGLEHAVRVLPPLLELVPDVALVVAGCETHQVEALRLGVDLRITDRIAIPGPTIGLKQLLRSASLLLVTGDSQEACSTIDLAIKCGLPTVIFPLNHDAKMRTSAGNPGLYIAKAREIAQRLQDGMGRATEGFDKANLESRLALSQSKGIIETHHDPKPANWIVRLGARFFDNTPRRTFTPIKTLDFSTLGLGDTMMAWAGLHALLNGGYNPIAQDCTMYVQGVLVGIGTKLFAHYGVHVLPATSSDRANMAGPILSPQSPRTWRELYRGIVGPDWRVNCFPAIDAQKPPLRADYRYDPWERFCLGLTERLLHRRNGWQAAPAEYVGSRIWMPVARKMGIFPVTFLALLNRSLPHLRAKMREIIEAFGFARPPTGHMAVFPSGRSYQAFSADFCLDLQRELQLNPATFYVPSDDPWISAYSATGLHIASLDTVEELLSVVLFSTRLVTTDSFTSHAAQFLRDDFVLVLSRDIRENVLHPAAHPIIVTNHPRCAPCHYVPRMDLTTCPAGYDRCVAFENRAFSDRVARAVVPI